MITINSQPPLPTEARIHTLPVLEVLDVHVVVVGRHLLNPQQQTILGALTLLGDVLNVHATEQTPQETERQLGMTISQI